MLARRPRCRRSSSRRRDTGGRRDGQIACFHFGSVVFRVSDVLADRVACAAMSSADNPRSVSPVLQVLRRSLVSHIMKSMASFGWAADGIGALPPPKVTGCEFAFMMAAGRRVSRFGRWSGDRA